MHALEALPCDRIDETTPESLQAIELSGQEEVFDPRVETPYGFIQSMVSKVDELLFTPPTLNLQASISVKTSHLEDMSIEIDTLSIALTNAAIVRNGTPAA